MISNRAMRDEDTTIIIVIERSEFAIAVSRSIGLAIAPYFTQET
jgi:hypothetical protein